MKSTRPPFLENEHRAGDPLADIESAFRFRLASFSTTACAGTWQSSEIAELVKETTGAHDIAG